MKERIECGIVRPGTGLVARGVVMPAVLWRRLRHRMSSNNPDSLSAFAVSLDGADG